MRIASAVGIAVTASRSLALFAALALALLGPWAARDAARERASYALGLSTGASFRGVLPMQTAALRQGLADGLGGEATQYRLMSRPELFARIRRVMKRLSAAELAAVAARIDAEQEH
jgi:hypothetical protein